MTTFLSRITWKIIIITHEKYKALSKSNVERKYFEDNRHVLIIDEFINMTNPSGALKDHVSGLMNNGANFEVLWQSSN